MQGIREYNKKINSLKNTRKITSSMKMISSVKLQRYTKLKQVATPFWESAREVFTRNNDFFAKNHSVFLDGFPSPRKNLILMISSDRGLCGRYNSNIIRNAIQLYDTFDSQGRQTSFSFIGSKGYTFFKRCKLPVHKYYEEIHNPDFSSTNKIADELLEDFVRGTFHEIWVVYSRKILLAEEPVSERLLPFEKTNTTVSQNDNIIIEEKPEVLLQNYVKMTIRAAVYKAHFESTVSEHSARMSAMDTATTNCDQMIQRYIKLRNRARQTQITTELSEIVSGKEAIDN
ncbi:MAG: ATP synthase F1 subunit gamma [Fibrobacter sp.]|nr:ATP synthase F1 subunit gamma [Fibrobacter sp.]